MDVSTDKLRVLELFSGIGGIHFAFRVSDIPHVVVASVDINTVANTVYKHNFPDSNLLQRNIQFLNAEIVDKLSPDIITMSPPCQPFTRQGLKNDCADARTQPLLHIISLIQDLKKKPRFIFLENVQGFEGSEACQRLLQVLRDYNYHLHQFLLSPKKFGVPNSRLRYYLLAKRDPELFCFASDSEVLETYPVCGSSSMENGKVGDYLQDLECMDEYLVSDSILLKHGMILDIVTAGSSNSCCFTKGYVQYVEGTGSVIQSNSAVLMDEIYKEVCTLPKDDPRRVDLLRKLGLRYFTPQEVSNLMCFPPEFSFPETVSDKQKYRLLGNSVNVRVVSALLRVLVCHNKDDALL